MEGNAFGVCCWCGNGGGCGIGPECEPCVGPIGCCCASEGGGTCPGSNGGGGFGRFGSWGICIPGCIINVPASEGGACSGGSGRIGRGAPIGEGTFGCIGGASCTSVPPDEGAGGMGDGWYATVLPV